MGQREEAIALRLAGKSRSQIKEALGLRTGGSTLSRWLKDVPPPEWTKRPNAKDDLRAKAVEMRKAGYSYRQILETLPLPVAKSSLSLWLRDVPLTESQHQALRARTQQAVSTRAQSIRAQRIRRQEATIAEAKAQVQFVTESELFVAGLAAYWAEGAKAKPWRPGGERVQFINSDPDMIRLFLRWLSLLGITSEQLIFRISIHENADIDAAIRYWTTLVGVPASEFRRPTLKRHNPKTVRYNTGDTYRGCLAIDVRRSTELYRRIAGWWAGLAEAALDPPDILGAPSGVV